MAFPVSPTNGQIYNNYRFSSNKWEAVNQALFNTSTPTFAKVFSTNADGLEIQNTGSPRVVFHKPGSFATELSLGSDNYFHMGGYSVGIDAAGLKCGELYSGRVWTRGYGVVNANSNSNGNFICFDDGTLIMRRYISSATPNANAHVYFPYTAYGISGFEGGYAGMSYVPTGLNSSAYQAWIDGDGWSYYIRGT